MSIAVLRHSQNSELTKFFSTIEGLFPLKFGDFDNHVVVPKVWESGVAARATLSRSAQHELTGLMLELWLLG